MFDSFNDYFERQAWYGPDHEKEARLSALRSSGGGNGTGKRSKEDLADWKARGESAANRKRIDAELELQRQENDKKQTAYLKERYGITF